MRLVPNKTWTSRLSVPDSGRKLEPDNYQRTIKIVAIVHKHTCSPSWRNTYTSGVLRLHARQAKSVASIRDFWQADPKAETWGEWLELLTTTSSLSALQKKKKKKRLYTCGSAAGHQHKNLNRTSCPLSNLVIALVPPRLTQSRNRLSTKKTVTYARRSQTP
jgi:hypothetical protein